MRDGVLQEKMSGNFLDKEKSYQAAESAQRVVQRMIASTSTEEVELLAGFVSISENPLGAHDARTLNFASTGFSVPDVRTGIGTNDYSGDPLAVVEELSIVNSLKTGKGDDDENQKNLAEIYYRVSTLGFGETANTTTRLQGVVSLK